MPVALSYPGVYVEEIPSGVQTITGVATSITAFVGAAQRGPVGTPVNITSYADFVRIFGGLWLGGTMGYAVRDFYANGGSVAIIVRVVHSGDADATKDAAKASIVLGGSLTLSAANEGVWGNHLRARDDHDVSADVATSFGLASTDLFNLYVRDMATGVVETFRNVTVKDSPRRVDKVLANESSLVVVSAALTTVPTASGATPPAGRVVWGSRTLQGDDRLTSEWKYVPVRRLALFLEESLFRGTQWVVFEPNDEPLWSQIRLNVGAFMHGLFRQGAFQGRTPQQAYFVKCDSETTTQNDINLGVVNIVVGFAPLKPAEFVVIQIQQMAGQIQS